MNVLFINSVCGTGSTGKICVELAKKYESEGNKVKIAYGRDGFVPEQYKKYAIRIGTNLDVRIHGVYTRLTDKHGFASKNATKKFLKWADEFNPDLLWIHNIHGYYINIEMLFGWIKLHPNIQVKWTLHDCWSFTGHCSHFTSVKCDKWKTHCENCPQINAYPKSLFVDNSDNNFERKRAAFSGVKNLTLITPSEWLANHVRESFLKEYPIEVFYNKIDENVFRPTPNDFRERYSLEDKKIVLGVANIWNEKKGYLDFFRLRKLLDEEKYIIVLVGLNDKQIRNLPKGIIGIKKTNSAKELAEIYTSADIFLNLTYEDSYPSVNLEAQACGTPIITYNTGGCRETISNPYSHLVDTGNIEMVAKYIRDGNSYAK